MRCFSAHVQARDKADLKSGDRPKDQPRTRQLIGGGCKPSHSKGSTCAPPIKCDGADSGAVLREQAPAAPHPRGSSAAVRGRRMKGAR